MSATLRASSAFGLLLLLAAGANAQGYYPHAAQGFVAPAGYAPTGYVAPASAVMPASASMYDGEYQLVGDCQSVGPASCGVAPAGDDACCLSDACDAELSCCDSAWIVSAGAIFLQRSRPDTAAIATPPTGTPGILINGTDFEFDWNPGFEFSIARQTSSGHIWEGRYFNSEASDSAFRIPAVTTFRVAGIGVTILGGGSINGQYVNTLHNAEFNVWRPVNPGCSFMLGFRAIEMKDRLNLDIATPNTFTRWEEVNRMYGAQVGMKLNLVSPGTPLTFDAIFKGGVYENFVDNRFRSTIVGSAADSEEVTSFVGEVNLSAAYQLTERLKLRAGYMILWLENVGLASDAAASTVQIAGGTSSPAPTEGHLWYHGATCGFEYVW